MQQLREGILEAYTGIVGGFKNTEKGTSDVFIGLFVVLIYPAAGLLLPHVPSILELVQKALADSERTESTIRLAIGLIGDLADTFPGGEIKQYLLAEWIASELRSRGRGVNAETKKTIRWAREVSMLCSSSPA